MNWVWILTGNVTCVTGLFMGDLTAWTSRSRGLMEMEMGSDRANDPFLIFFKILFRIYFKNSVE